MRFDADNRSWEGWLVAHILCDLLDWDCESWSDWEEQ